MTMFEQPSLSDEAIDFPAPTSAKRPSRLSPANWSVRWKVLAIVLIPVALAVALAGLRVYNNVTDARDLRHAADRAELVTPLANYTGSLESALLAYSSGTDGPVARKAFDDSRAELERKLTRTAVDPDVREGIGRLLKAGPALLDQVASNGIGLRDTVQAYAPILLTAEDAIVGSVRVDDEAIRSQAQGLSRAVGVRGQMLMQKLLVNRGGELPDPVLRTSMVTVAGTEPSALFGVSQVLGVGSPDAKTLQDQFVARMTIISDPATVLAGNPDLLQSLQTTDDIAKKVISNTTASVTSAVDNKASTARTAAIRDSAIVAGAILVALLLVFLVARSLVRPLRRLREGALRVAHEDLPDEIERINAGEQPGEIEPIPVHTMEEIGQVAHAVDDLHEQALLLAAEQARLQLHVSDMFETMSRRSRSLVDQQLTLIDDLERNEDDPQRLDALFKLDHLAARMGRNGTNLLILAGAKIRREQTEPMPVADVISAAASQVESYQRVVTATVPESSVVADAAGDIVHLLAELVDNALRYSSPDSEVRVSAVHTGNRGLVIEVSDSGLGMTEGDLRMANMRLDSGGEVTPYTTRHMGLFVVGRLARQHGLVVRLRSSVAGEPRSGMTAGVFIPIALLHRADAPHSTPEAAFQPVADPVAEVASSATLHSDVGLVGKPYRNGSAREGSVLPQRDPGTSGIVGGPEPEGVQAPVAPRTPADTSAFFSSREQAAETEPQAVEAEPQTEPQAPVEETPPAAGARPPSSPLGDTDVIFQRMVSEWLVDPQDLMPPMQSWESVWDNGWAAAEDAEVAPVDARTENGLPVREPGARLVPGSAQPGRPNGAAHRKDDEGDGDGDGDEPFLRRDPDAVRASLSSHWGGVRAGRSHARDEPDDE
jgi:signal transduction histidine kinase